MKQAVVLSVFLAILAGIPTSAYAMNEGERAERFVAGVYGDVMAGIFDLEGDAEKEFSECRRTYAAHFDRNSFAERALGEALIDKVRGGGNWDAFTDSIPDLHCLFALGFDASVMTRPPHRHETGGGATIRVYSDSLEDGELTGEIVWFVRSADDGMKLYDIAFLDREGRQEPPFSTIMHEALRDQERHYEGDFWLSAKPLREFIDEKAAEAFREDRNEKAETQPTTPTKGPIDIYFPSLDVALKTYGCEGKRVSLEYVAVVTSSDDEGRVREAMGDIGRLVRAHIQDLTCQEPDELQGYYGLREDIITIIESKTRGGLVRDLYFMKFEHPGL